MFGLDAGAADAARAAVTPGPRPPVGPRPNPFAATLASPGVAKANVPPPLAPAANDRAVPSVVEEGEEEESTRAVPREELLRGQDGQVVVGDDVGTLGEDATLAVGPGENEASSKHLAALAQTMAAEPEQGFLPPAVGVFPPPPGPNAVPPPSLGGPPAGWNEAWGAGAGPGPGAPMEPPRMGSNPQVGSNPQMPVSSPHGMMGMPQSGQMPMNMAGPAGMPTHHPMQAPIPYPGQQGGPMMQGQNPWGQPASMGANMGGNMAGNTGGKGIKLSNQIVLLAIVGVICLAIFITGIVLFVTTKF